MSLRCRRSLADSGSEGVKVFSEVGQNEDDISEALTMASLDEIRRLTNPPMPVRRTLEVVHLVLHAQQYWRGVPPDGVKWERVQRTVSSEDFVQRLQGFSIEALRQFPNLARDLHEVYFSPDAGSGQRRLSSRRSYSVARISSKGRVYEALSPQRVRHASNAAAALFSWAAKTVTAALPDPDEPRRPRRSMSVPERLVSPRLPDSPVGVLAELPESDADKEETRTQNQKRLTVGVWMTCPVGHGLEVGCVGPSPICAICKLAIIRGGDSAACRQCGFFVCVECRKGGWLSVNVAAGNGQEAPMGLVDFDVVGFRCLRAGEALPEPLCLESSLTHGAMGCWGKDGPPDSPELDGGLQLELRADFPQALCASRASSAASLLCGVEYKRFRRGASNTRASAVFGLTDVRGLGANVLLALCGCPGTN